ncbi:M16 family metallopeptidase [Limibacillus halophilus]
MRPTLSASPTFFTLRAFFLCASLLLLAAAPLRAEVFDPESFTLDNGLQVVVVNNDRAPIVQHMIWYKVGAADEPPGKSGIAHFLEHLMFKGTERLKPGEFSQIIAQNGGQENAFTSLDYTGYFQTIAKDRLELMMENEADRMVNLQLTDDVVLPELQVVIEERRSRTDNEPGSQLYEMGMATLYLNHPYGTPVIGWPQELSALTTQDALDFYRQWYQPNNAVLVVVGDVTAEEVRPMVERTYGKIPRGPEIERRRLSEPPQTAARRVVLESERVRQPSLSVDYLAPSYNTVEGPEPYALQVLSELLGGAASARLYRSLVIDQGIAVSAGSYYDASAYDISRFGFYASPRQGVELEDLEAALRAEIRKLLDEGVSDQEVAEAKQRLTAAAIYARDNLSTPARVIGGALATGQSLEDIEAWPERIEAVTAEEIMSAARAVIDETHSVTRELRAKPTS